MRHFQDFAKATGIGFGYFLQPPAGRLPVPDFREGFATAPTASADLIAVLSKSQRRQDWYRDYVLSNGGQPLGFVGSAADSAPADTAPQIRRALNFEVADRRGSWSETRKTLLQGFEALGGLTVATSMVENNTKRRLNDHEFRGFALVDEIAPLGFVNTHQTLNGQIFTLAHEFAHVWRATSGIGTTEFAVGSDFEILLDRSHGAYAGTRRSARHAAALRLRVDGRARDLPAVDH